MSTLRSGFSNSALCHCCCSIDKMNRKRKQNNEREGIWKWRRISRFLPFFLSHPLSVFFLLCYIHEATHNESNGKSIFDSILYNSTKHTHILSQTTQERQTNSITFVNKSFAMPFFCVSSVALLVWLTIVHRIFIHFWSVTTFDMDTDRREHCFCRCRSSLLNFILWIPLSIHFRSYHTQSQFNSKISSVKFFFLQRTAYILHYFQRNVCFTLIARIEFSERSLFRSFCFCWWMIKLSIRLLFPFHMNFMIIAIMHASDHIGFYWFVGLFNSCTHLISFYSIGRIPLLLSAMA